MDTLFFIVSKLARPFLLPETWLVMGFVVARLMLRRFPNGGRKVLTVTILLTLIIAVFPLGTLLLRPLESRYSPNPELTHIDGIVVLGGSMDIPKSVFWGQVQLAGGSERLISAIDLSRRYPDAKIVLTGGSGQLRDLAGATASEVEMAERFFLAQNLDPARLILEDTSRNTWENAHNSFALAQPLPEQTWVLVTSAAHMSRAMYSFQQVGWSNIIPYPVDYKTGRFVDDIGWNLAGHLGQLNGAMYEYIGLAAYMWKAE